MHVCGCLLVSGLVSIILLHCSDGLRVQPQHLDWTASTSSQLHPKEVKERKALRVKLLRADDQVEIENDVMEPKRKRSFPGNNAPLDRLSISSMETKQATNKQSKELPRQRVKPPPIDRIGINRLPNSRG
ncbi:osteocrin [Betta splendens]|uniref:Osteocrin n=1 Tax=Betta splendens TaxID=158456 RepID=A0A6P7P3H9_BETSP|nr:osteocrin [Betta splendens]XP_055369685.1 osteocrin [Betta splendens]